MYKYLFGLCLIVTLVAKSASAQSYDLYSHLVNPETLAILNSADSTPLHWAEGVGWPSVYYQNNFVLASDSGAGVISHIWFNLQDKPDTSCIFTIIVDDQVVFTGYMYDFFKQQHGLFRPPLDSLASGGLVCDVQIPYKKNFKVMFKLDFSICCLFWAIGWRPIPNDLAMSITAPETIAGQQSRAEQAYWNGGSPWPNGPQLRLQRTNTIGHGDTMVCADILGSGLIRTLHLTPGSYDSSELDSLKIRMSWDGSAYPSVDVPLGDFFGFACGPRTVRSLLLRSDTVHGFTSYFPMPFYDAARIEIINEASRPITISSDVGYTQKPIDRNAYGYFSAQFNESNPALFLRQHPVAFARGRGRLVGVQYALPDALNGYFLEGDPFLTIDSSSSNRITYTGTEDFFNGGWFFVDGTISNPFAGCTNLYTTFYRFMVMDCIDFKHSLDFTTEHGDHSKYVTTYRTISYLYTHWTPYWLSNDTMIAGETIHVGGTGYLANEPVTVRMDTSVLLQGNADANGHLDLSFKVPTGFTAGGHDFYVNDEKHEWPVRILDAPQVHTLHTLLPRLNWRDTLTLWGTGFQPGERLEAYLDTTKVNWISPAMADSSHSFTARFQIPWVPDGHYHIRVAGSMGDVASTDTTFDVTRSLNYECEDLWPPLSADDPASHDYMVYFSNYWSNQAYLLFLGSAAGHAVTEAFDVPVADTYQPVFFLTYGIRFGIYDVLIDDQLSLHVDLFQQRDWGDPIRTDSLYGKTTYLSAGRHRLTFRCAGQNPAADQSILGADNMVLLPVTPFKPLLVDTSHPPTPTELPVLSGFDARVYPNPVSEKTRIAISVPGEPSADEELHVELFDATGKLIRSIYNGRPYLRQFTIEQDYRGLANGNYLCRVLYIVNSVPRTLTLPVKISQ